MWKKTYSTIIKNVQKDDVWRVWTDVNNWPTWHNDLEYCKINGAFEKGNHFILKPKGASAIKIILTDINPGHSFTDCTNFFGAKMYDTHTIEETKDGLLLTNTLIVTGPLKWIWIKLVAQNVASTVPNDMKALIHLIQTTTMNLKGSHHV